MYSCLEAEMLFLYNSHMPTELAWNYLPYSLHNVFYTFYLIRKYITNSIFFMQVIRASKTGGNIKTTTSQSLWGEINFYFKLYFTLIEPNQTSIQHSLSVLCLPFHKIKQQQITLQDTLGDIHLRIYWRLQCQLNGRHEKKRHKYQSPFDLIRHFWQRRSKRILYIWKS